MALRTRDLGCEACEALKLGHNKGQGSRIFVFGELVVIAFLRLK